MGTQAAATTTQPAWRVPKGLSQLTDMTLGLIDDAHKNMQANTQSRVYQ